MQKKILVFGASNSKESINSRFAHFAGNQLLNVDLNFIKLDEFALPVYSIDLERANGIHKNAQKFFSLIQASDGIVASFAEHNGLYTSAFKNLWDWMSRIPMEQPFNIWDNKPLLLLSTSPSKRPMNNVIKVSKHLFPKFGANIIADFYLPSFNHFFKKDVIIEPTYKQNFESALEKFQLHINQN